MPLEQALLLKIAGAVFGVLFLMNWVCALSSQKINGFRWGDFVLVLVLSVVIFTNLPRLRSFASLIPDSFEIFALESKSKVRKIHTGIRDTRQTVGQVSEYLKDVARRELEYQMQMDTPARQDP